MLPVYPDANVNSLAVPKQVLPAPVILVATTAGLTVTPTAAVVVAAAQTPLVTTAL